MSKENNITDLLTDVAEAIRAKEGSTDLINPQDFSARIAAISGGVELKFINFMPFSPLIYLSNKYHLYGTKLEFGQKFNAADVLRTSFNFYVPSLTVPSTDYFTGESYDSTTIIFPDKLYAPLYNTYVPIKPSYTKGAKIWSGSVGSVRSIESNSFVYTASALSTLVMPCQFSGTAKGQLFITNSSNVILYRTYNNGETVDFTVTKEMLDNDPYHCCYVYNQNNVGSASEASSTPPSGVFRISATDETRTYTIPENQIW